MAKIAYILLCHKDPEAIIAQAQRLTRVGDCVAIHFDARAPKAAYRMLRDSLDANPNVCFSKRRVKCGWGEWSLVQATLHALTAAEDAFPGATHFYMLSGDCMPIKTAEYAKEFLAGTDRDYIESFDFFESDWIKTGMKEDRLIYRHFFNERTQPKRFYRSYEWQKKLDLTRKIPSDLDIQIGSQWWCLRRLTVEKILAFVKERRDVMRFFATTWIPDETFFQTLVRHLVPKQEIESRTLTFLLFTDYGVPLTLYNDHFDLLMRQDYLFARKVSPDATELIARLGALYEAQGQAFEISDEGRALYDYTAKRGRKGARFGRRFWENAAAIGRDREVLIVSCKKWHVAKRLLDGIRAHNDLVALDYVFHEDSAELPDLGGLENALEKRLRHPRAVMGLLFDHFGTDRILFCVDPSALALVQDFYGDQSQTRLLQVECEVSDDYFTGHAQRVGLITEASSAATIERLLPALRNDERLESNALRAEGFGDHHILRERDSTVQQATALAAFLGLSPEAAHGILADQPHLFSD